MMRRQQWLTRQQLAAYLGVSLRQVGRLKIARTYVGRTPRFARSAVERYIAAQQRPKRKNHADEV